MPSIRIIEGTIFRRAHAEPGREIHDCSIEEASLMVGVGRAVLISRREIAQAVPVIEVPEHRAEATPSAALHAEMTANDLANYALRADGIQAPGAMVSADQINPTTAKRPRKPRAPRSPVSA